MLWLALAQVAWPCTSLIYDDYGDGSADGAVYGGTFVPGGWRPDGGTIVYDLPDVVAGVITMRISNLDERDVAQHDLLELFSGDDGSFSDGRRDNFLQVKYAGDIYDGYDGRIKLQAGPEWYGDYEVGAWTAEYDWNEAESYDFTISWGGTVANLDVDGTLTAGIDYGYYGELAFRTLRVPNDGSYTRDGLLDDIVIAGVSLCGDLAETDTDTDADSDTDTDSDTDADSDTDTDTDSDTDTDADTDTVGSLVIRELSVDPADVTVGESWVVRWALEGAEAARFCFRGEGETLETCADLPGATGRMPIPTDGLAPGLYDGVLSAEGPEGTVESERIPLSVTAAGAVPGGCAVPGGSASALGCVVAALAAGVRRGRRG